MSSFREQAAFITRNRWALLGFVTPISALICIPYVGPLFFLLAHATVPVFYVDFLHQKDQPAIAGVPASDAVDRKKL